MSRQGLKSFAKSILPGSLVRALNDRRARMATAQYKNLSTQQIFSKIYEEGAWGGPTSGDDKFYSGSGSHDAEVVTAYVACVREFIDGLDFKPTALDLGCGDFSVGQQIVGYCSGYTAVDIVPSLIERNRRKFADLDVTFECMNIAEDDIPAVDIIFVRQVLQHLSNADIVRAVRKMEAKARYIVCTEHLPATPDFVPNLDKDSGPDTRLTYDSGVVLHAPPFNIASNDYKVICEVAYQGTIIRTHAYRIAQQT